MNPQASQSDDDLLRMLDEPGLWLVRGGPTGVLAGPLSTLRAALHQAYELSMQGKSPGPIVRMPDDNVHIAADQIYRLWRSLGFAVR